MEKAKKRSSSLPNWRGESFLIKRRRKVMAMDTLRSVAHLQKELGDRLFKVLISSDNTKAVRKLAEKLDKDAIPTEMTIAGCTYEIFCFLKGNETSVSGKTMVKRAKELKACLGEEDFQHILEHQDEIPTVLRGKVYFVFMDGRHPDSSGRVTGIDWCGGRWVQCWGRLGGSWGGSGRVLRRKS